MTIVGELIDVDKVGLVGEDCGIVDPNDKSWARCRSRVRCVGNNQMVGELFKETSRRRVASSKGGEMIRIFKIV